MTTLNIPGSPNPGDTYEENGVIYTWNGEYWTANNAQGFDDRYVNADGDQMAGDLTVPSLNGGQLAGFRNQIINGCLRNWQRGTAGNGTHYGADRMFFANPGTGGNNERDTNAPPESGLQYSYAINENAILVNSVEIPPNGSPFVNGSEWTFSFYARLDIRETSDNEIQFATGNASASNAVSLASGFTWSKETLASGWRRYSYTFTVGSNPNAGNNCLRLWFRNVATRNTVTGFQLEPGPVATPFEHRPIGTELALCQRYYQKPSKAFILSGFGENVGGTRVFQQLLVTTMRNSPSVAVFDTNGTQGRVTAKDNAGGNVTGQSINVYSFPDRIEFDAGPNVVTYNGYWINWTADAEL